MSRTATYKHTRQDNSFARVHSSSPCGKLLALFLLLLAFCGKGAAPTLFSAAMLGQLDVVRALVAAQPGIQRQKGPHGITLLSHARAGGVQALEVLEYLRSLGDADSRPPLAPLSDEQMAAVSGEYAWGPGKDERFLIVPAKGLLTLLRPGGSARNLFHLGAYSFYPAGADAARIRFTLESGKGAELTVHDPAPVLSAKRVQ